MPTPTLVPIPCPADVTCLYELDRKFPTVALPASIWCMALSVVDGPVTSQLSAVRSCVPNASQCMTLRPRACAVVRVLVPLGEDRSVWRIAIGTLAKQV